MSVFFQNPLLYIIAVLLVAFFVCVVAHLRGAGYAELRPFCLGASLLALFLTVLSCLAFNKSLLGFQFLFRLPVVAQDNLTFSLGADGLSMVFLLLTLFVFPICFASS